MNSYDKLAELLLADDELSPEAKAALKAGLESAKTKPLVDLWKFF